MRISDWSSDVCSSDLASTTQMTLSSRTACATSRSRLAIFRRSASMPKQRDLATVRRLREDFDADLASGSLSIGQAVRRMRELSGLTQEAFARHRGITLPTLKRIELHKAHPTDATPERLPEGLGLQGGFRTEKGRV